MKTHTWEGLKLFTINKELQDLIDTKIVKTIVSLSLISVSDPNSLVLSYSAILIYK